MAGGRHRKGDAAAEDERFDNGQNCDIIPAMSNGHVTHRATKEIVDLVEDIRDIIEGESGIRPSRSRVVELAIRELAKRKKAGKDPRDAGARRGAERG